MDNYQKKKETKRRTDTLTYRIVQACSPDKTFQDIQKELPDIAKGTIASALRIYNLVYRRDETDSITGEEWKSVPNWENLYEVSNLGRIKKITPYRVKIIKGTVSDAGIVINLQKNTIRRETLLKRIVAIAWIPNPDNMPHVMNVDEDIYNNKVDNLKWFIGYPKKVMTKEIKALCAKERYRSPEHKERILQKIREKSLEITKNGLTVGRERALKIKYKITGEQYLELLQKCNNKCEICNKEETTEYFVKDNAPRVKVLNVDHCHSTNKVRGILCAKCNKALGLVHEDTTILENMIQYIKKHNNPDIAR